MSEEVAVCMMSNHNFIIQEVARQMADVCIMINRLNKFGSFWGTLYIAFLIKCLLLHLLIALIDTLTFFAYLRTTLRLGIPY